MSLKSVKVRFAVSLVTNGTRAGISFLTGLLLARALAPGSFGDYSFLLGSFLALRLLLDLGSSNAFFTLIAGRSRGPKYYFIYFGWLAVQFILTSVVILFLPGSMMTRIWLGHPRSVILLAFLAAFLQQQVWLTISQVGESSRHTVRVQVMNISLAIAHLGLVLALIMTHRISILSVFSIIILEYVLVALWAFRWLKPEMAPSGEDPSYRTILREFAVYCRPLVFLAIAEFLCDFADKWLLQNFGGSRQQGFYQVSYQVASVSLLATTSIVRVFWKEVAEASARMDRERVAYLYRRVTRVVMMFGAVVSAFVIPWTRELIALLLGSNYLLAAPALAIMFLYPVHQALGQIGGALLLASGNTRVHMLITVSLMALFPISYFVLASRTAIIPGLGLGALGMSLKMVLLNMFSVNLQAYIIARIFCWKYDWLYQVVGLGAALALGTAAKSAARFLWHPADNGKLTLIASVGLAGLIYLPLVAALLWYQPWLIGMRRDELDRMSQKVLGFFTRQRQAM